MAEKFFERHRASCKIEAENFIKLPRKCQEMFFEQLTRHDEDSSGYMPFFVCGFPEGVQSPIESIFLMAFNVINYEYYDNLLCLESQYEIKTDGKKYRADFVFDTELLEYQVAEKAYKLVIECDGHEFHKATKEQVKKDNERDMALKKLGYDVLHYSGSQIYEEPWKCADEVCSYIFSKIGTVREV